VRTSADGWAAKPCGKVASRTTNALRLIPAFSRSDSFV
jgi:hypothetical protein